MNFEANNKFMLTTNQNYASPSSGEEEQKPNPIVGHVLRGVLLVKLTHGKEARGGLCVNILKIYVRTLLFYMGILLSSLFFSHAIII